MTPAGRPDLAAVLGFSADELMLNRAGRVSPRQRALLLRSRRLGLVWAACLVAGAVALAAEVPPTAVVLCGATLLVLAAIRTVVHHVVGARAIHMVTGPVRVRTHRVRHEVTIGRTTFVVMGRSGLDAFADGLSYRAYYATGPGRALGRLLSAEPV